MSTLVNGSGDAAVGELVELHEHEVPDLEPARAVLAVVRDALRALGRVRAAVEVDLAARPARAGVGHPPEVAVVACVDVAPARHALGRQADLVAPDVPGDLVVACTSWRARRSPGMPKISVRKSQAQWIASRLK